MMFMCTPFLPSWLMAHPALKFTDSCTNVVGNEFASLIGYQSRVGPWRLLPPLLITRGLERPAQLAPMSQGSASAGSIERSVREASARIINRGEANKPLRFRLGESRQSATNTSRQAYTAGNASWNRDVGRTPIVDTATYGQAMRTHPALPAGSRVRHAALRSGCA